MQKPSLVFTPTASTGLSRRVLPFILAIPLLLGGCGVFGGSKPETGTPVASMAKGTKPKTRTAPVELSSKPTPPAATLYRNGVAELRRGKNKKAVALFSEVEVNYPYSTWATHAELLHGYAEYRRQDFVAAIGALTRFVQLHPANPEAAYAYYLRALCYYEQIGGVQQDQTPTREADQALQEVVTRFPNTAYASDARIKLRLVANRLAGHDMVIGRFYERQHLYAAAIRSYQKVVQQYQTTTFVPEALERLVECYLDLGLRTQAHRVAAVLGYNYPGSHWYEDAYRKLRDHGLIADTPQPAHQSGGFLFGLL